MQPDESDECYLLAQLKEGNQQAFEHIYNTYWPGLARRAYAKVRSTEVVEELLQTLFLQLWASRQTLIIQKSLADYLYASLKHAILRHLRQQTLQQRYVDEMLFLTDEASDSTQEMIFYNDLHEHLQGALNQLPDKCREAFLLSRDEGYSLKEIAQAMHISPKTAEHHISKALRLLRGSLKDVTTLLPFLLLLRG